jgi:hypothetical protein
MNEKLLELKIKALLLNYLVNKGDLNSSMSVINEFTIDKLSRRADLVALDDKKMVAYEIKSEADTLKRLDGQVTKYLEYFDKVVIVAATKHINSVIAMVPSNVAVWEVTDNNFTVRQRGRIEIIKSRNSLISLLNSKELLKLSKKLNLSIKLKSRKSLEEILSKSPIYSLREAALNNIKRRYRSTNDNFWNKTEKRNISTQDITLLSHYIYERKQEKNNKVKKQQLWANWELKLKQDPEVLALYNLSQKLISV